MGNAARLPPPPLSSSQASALPGLRRADGPPHTAGDGVRSGQGAELGRREPGHPLRRALRRLPTLHPALPRLRPGWKGFPASGRNSRSHRRGDSHADRKGTLILPCTLLMATTWPRRRWTMEGRSAGGRVGLQERSSSGRSSPAPPPTPRPRERRRH